MLHRSLLSAAGSDVVGNNGQGSAQVAANEFWAIRTYIKMWNEEKAAPLTPRQLWSLINPRLHASRVLFLQKFSTLPKSPGQPWTCDCEPVSSGLSKPHESHRLWKEEHWNSTHLRLDGSRLGGWASGEVPPTQHAGSTITLATLWASCLGRALSAESWSPGMSSSLCFICTSRRLMSLTLCSPTRPSDHTEPWHQLWALCLWGCDGVMITPAFFSPLSIWKLTWEEGARWETDPLPGTAVGLLVWSWSGEIGSPRIHMSSVFSGRWGLGL